MKLKRPLFGPDDPRGPSKGRDVKDFVKRTLNRLPGMQPVGENFFPRPIIGYKIVQGRRVPIYGPFDDIYNAKTQEGVEVFQKFNDISPATGQFGARTFEVMWAYADAYSKWAYRMWSVPVPPDPPLIEPIQGFKSLTHSLWEDYSLGRRMGLSDLGTYNPSSTLPSGAKSDHAYYPALAFDLGIDPDIGWDNLTARAFFNSMVGKPEISYVILGDKIWSQDKGLHAYTYGGHENHVHTSGRH